MRTIQSIVVAVAMLAATMLLAANANAQCAVTSGTATSSKAATFLEKSAAAPKPAAIEKPQFFGFVTIVGFWHSTFTAGSTVVDDGFAAWHPTAPKSSILCAILELEPSAWVCGNKRDAIHTS